MMGLLLPRQQSADSLTGQRWSLARDQQLRDALEAGLDALLGHGVIRGGVVTASGLNLTLPAGTAVFAGGASYTTGSDLHYSVFNGFSWVLWGTLTRTQGSDPNTAPTVRDTYSLVLAVSADLTTPPDPFSIPLAQGVASGGATTVDNNPPGKYLHGAWTTVLLNAHSITIPVEGATYQVGVDFSSAGQFQDPAYHAIASCASPAGVVIVENQAPKSVSHCYWTVYVPSPQWAGYDSAGGYASVGPYGPYPVSNSLSLAVTLVGRGWSGAAGPFSGVWDAPAEVL